MAAQLDHPEISINIQYQKIKKRRTDVTKRKYKKEEKRRKQ